MKFWAFTIKLVSQGVRRLEMWRCSVRNVNQVCGIVVEGLQCGHESCGFLLLRVAANGTQKIILFYVVNSSGFTGSRFVWIYDCWCRVQGLEF